MEKYEKQQEILQKRRSYSKTDTDATFMRMKEDHMRNGQLKPGYNIQIGTENQFVTGFSIHQRPGDTSCMKPHLEHLKELHGRLPENIIADAGYGSEENYEFLESEPIEHFVKYNTFHKEKSKKWQKDATRVQNWYYVSECDEYICGYGRYFGFLYEKKQKSEKPDSDRRVYINRRLNELKKIVNANLTSERGLLMRSKRPVEVESAYGDIRGLYSIGHNIRKMAVSRG